MSARCELDQAYVRHMSTRCKLDLAYNYELSAWCRLDSSCFHCPADVSWIRYISDVQHVSAVRLAQVISCVYQMYGGCKLHMACMSCPAGAN